MQDATMLNCSAISPVADPRMVEPEMRAVHIVAGLEVAHGGPSYSVPRLCDGLARRGVDTTLLSVKGTNDVAHLNDVPNFHVHRHAQDYANIPVLRNLRASFRLVREMRGIAPSVDIMHDHGLWLMPNVHAGREAARAGKPLIVSPRGMLSAAALSFSRWKKKAFWTLLQGPAIRGAACFHATGDGEYADVRAAGLGNPVAIIPNGIDIPEMEAPMPAAGTGERVVLSLGRIHPKKGLDSLVRAWAAVEGAHPQWRLKIVGPSEGGHADELRALAVQLGLRRVEIGGPLYGEGKSGAYREAGLFVLSSLNENFGLTIAESLAAGTPVISTKGTPWSGLEREGCGWWVDHGVEPLAAALSAAMVMPSEALHGMGLKGRAWMERDFSWDRVSLDMIAVYGWLSGKGPMPQTVRTD